MQNQRAIKSTALLNLKTEISKDLIVDYIIDHLIDTDVFTEEDKNTILSSGQSKGRVDDLLVRDEVLKVQSEYFIDLLSKKMETKDFAYNNFIFILMKEGYYPWLGEKILKMVLQMNAEAEMVAQLSATPPFLCEKEGERHQENDRKRIVKKEEDMLQAMSLSIREQEECRQENDLTTSVDNNQDQINSNIVNNSEIELKNKLENYEKNVEFLKRELLRSEMENNKIKLEKQKYEEEIQVLRLSLFEQNRRTNLASSNFYHQTGTQSQPNSISTTYSYASVTDSRIGSSSSVQEDKGDSMKEDSNNL